MNDNQDTTRRKNPGILHRLKLRLTDIPIFNRLTIIIILVFFAIFLLSYTNFSTFTKDKRQTTLNMVNQTNHQAISKIDDYIADLSNITKFPLTHKYNDISYLRELEAFEEDGISSMTFQKLNEQMFNDILGYKESLNSCFIFNTSGKADYKVEIPIYQAFNPSQEDWFLETIKKFGKPNIVRTYELPYVVKKNSPHYVFGISRGIVRFETSTVIGVLLVNTDIDYLRKVCDNMKVSNDERIVILDGDYTIYDTKEDNIAKTARDDIKALHSAGENKIKKVEMDGQELWISSINSSYTGWHIIRLIPTKDLFSDLESMQRSTVLLSAIILIFTVLVILLISRQIVNPIKKLQMLMKLAETGNFDNPINIHSHDEIGSLAHSFNSMIQKINSLIQEVYLEQIKQGETELQMLQSQINPHFLYNTLESISMMATINDDDTTSEMAADLGTILRYGISKDKSIVTVAEEIRILEKYIRLQGIRFHDAYKVELSIDTAILEHEMIKLILQPIVENAIYHGMSTIRKGGLIVVKGYEADGLLHFTVSDNGKGMNEEQTASLNGYINDENNNFKSIGLRNVNKRIKLRYGEAYGIRITSQLDNGTTVMVVFPCEPV